MAQAAKPHIRHVFEVHSSFARGVGLPLAALRAPRISTRLSRAAILVTLTGVSAWAVLILFTGTNATSNGLMILYRVYAVAAPALVGLAWWRQRPDSRTGTLLMLLAICASVMAWQASAFTYRFSFGVLAEAPYTFLVILLCLTFPTGRLEGPVAKALSGLTAATLLLTFVPWLISGSAISGSNPVFDCWPSCPPNAFQLATLSDSARDALAGACYVAISVIGLGVVGLFVSRFRRAARPRKRALGALALTSMLVFPAAALFVAGALVFGAMDAERIGLTVSLAVAVIAFPVGFAVPLIAAELAAASELQGMIRHLTTSPTRAEWRDTVATVLDDAHLRLGYWDDSADKYVDGNGGTLGRANADPDRLWIEIADDGGPIAAIATDPALSTEPELTQAVAMATVAAASARRLEGARREVSARAADAAEAERVRIAREIEAGPQQRLAALRGHIDLLAVPGSHSRSNAFIDEFGRGVDRAIDELGDAARSHASTNLAEHGLGAALRAARADSPVGVRIWDIGLRRHPKLTERAVYYCALEAIQNTAKHAGPGASVTIRLSERQGGLDFVFEDDGVGFVLEAVAPGSGLANIRERIDALGGEVRVDSQPGRGTIIRGSAPDRTGVL